MSEEQKAKELVLTYGKEVAKKVCGLLIDELQTDWNQERIDFYLDVINKIDTL